MTLQQGTQLFRYDLGNSAPQAWSTQYHSPEYNYYPGLGYKNQIGAFYFYNNIETAISVLNAAIIRSNQVYPHNSITQCQTNADIEILDLSTGVNSPVDILHVLHQYNINVLTDQFRNHAKEFRDNFRQQHYFSEISTEFQDLLQLIGRPGMPDQARISRKNEIINNFLVSLQYAGQLLTDFENGSTFKILLQRSGYAGYQFTEEQTSPTICLFDSYNLSDPIHL